MLSARVGISAIQKAHINDFRRAGEQVFGRQFIDVVVGNHATAYYLIARLGGGSFGSVYTASQDATRVPQFAIKSFKLTGRTGNYVARGETIRTLGFTDDQPAPGDEQFLNTFVEQEYRVAQFIKMRVSEQEINESFVLAFDRFYSGDSSTGYIVFPYEAGVTLAQYTKVRLAVIMQHIEHDLSVRQFGITSGSLDQLIAIANDETHPAAATEMAAILTQLTRLWEGVMSIAEQLMEALAILHRVGVVHMDLKPDNMLLVNGALKLIDMGFACTPLVEDPERMAPFFQCANVYISTYLFMDPLAAVQTAPIELPEAALALFSAFDVYAAGKTIQTMCEPHQYNENAHIQEDIIIRRTLFQPPGLHELLVRMTGEQNYARPDWTKRPTISADEANERRHNLVARPSADQAADLLDAIDTQWRQQ